ncbi:MAG: universal stress protein [Solirubrobacteraceae bacterium]|jgi:nucleotide-binding universal stress UspA family protein
MILLTYDGSASATHAIATAHELLGDVPATVVHVWDPPVDFLPTDPFGGLQTWSPTQVAELESMILERANRILEEGVTLARQAGFDAEGRLERTSDAPWKGILEAAETLDAKLIVVGARGHSTVESLVLGAVSNAVVHHSKRSVLVIPRVS